MCDTPAAALTVPLASRQTPFGSNTRNKREIPSSLHVAKKKKKRATWNLLCKQTLSSRQQVANRLWLAEMSERWGKKKIPDQQNKQCKDAHFKNKAFLPDALRLIQSCLFWRHREKKIVFAQRSKFIYKFNICFERSSVFASLKEATQLYFFTVSCARQQNICTYTNCHSEAQKAAWGWTWEANLKANIPNLSLLTR